jgi:hypothetical protein
MQDGKTEAQEYESSQVRVELNHAAAFGRATGVSPRRLNLAHTRRIYQNLERTPKVDYEFAEIVSNVVQLSSECRCRFDFVNLGIRLVRVRLNNFMVWTAVDESTHLSLEVEEVFFRAI